MDQINLWRLIPLAPAGALPPLLLSVCMAVSDWRTRRIPNYLTFGGALAGLVFQTAVSGLSGLTQGVTGLLLGFTLLLLPYIYGGMGAGDVKALAALGAWLGPRAIFSVFCYMGLAGGLLSLGFLIAHGALWNYLRQGWIFLQNLILCRSRQIIFGALTPESKSTPGLPYGVAIALGMVAYVTWGNLF